MGILEKEGGQLFFLHSQPALRELCLAKDPELSQKRG